MNGECLVMARLVLQFTAVAAIPGYVNTAITDDKVNKYLYLFS